MFGPKFKIKKEPLCGSCCWMIYKREFFMWHFHERWNTLKTATIRLKELAGKDKKS